MSDYSQSKEMTTQVPVDTILANILTLSKYLCHVDAEMQKKTIKMFRHVQSSDGLQLFKTTFARFQSTRKFKIVS